MRTSILLKTGGCCHSVLERLCPNPSDNLDPQSTGATNPPPYFIPVTSAMLLSAVDLQREPIQFKLAFEPGSIEYGFDIRQLDPLAVDGRADLIVEHRGPGQMIDDIRIRATYAGRFEVLCARCLDPVEYPLSGQFDLLFR